MSEIYFGQLQEVAAPAIAGERAGLAGRRSILPGTRYRPAFAGHSLVDCYEASQTFAFIAVILDCVDEQAKQFYQRFDFAELPGYPMRLYLSFKSLETLAKAA